MISNNPNERNLPLHTADKLFKWDDVKDYIIPFLIRLDKEYDVSSRVYFYEYLRNINGLLLVILLKRKIGLVTHLTL